MVPVEWTGKRLTARQWYDEQRAGDRLMIKARMNGDDYPEDIEARLMAARHLHGFGEGALAFLID
jgi:hypothetical protein